MAIADVKRLRRLGCAVACWVAFASLSGPSRAQVPLSRLAPFLDARAEKAWARGNHFSLPSLRARRSDALWADALPALNRRLPRVADADVRAFRAAHPDALWSPPLHLLMDRARNAVQLPQAIAAGAGSGQGVVIGIVDAGLDVTHRDLRNPDGTTRVAWWIDFANDPAGLHPELEAAYGCEPRAGVRCRILSGADLDALIQNDVSGDEPTDPIGHGTHIASLAAGNGQSRSDGAFAGIAPEATLIVARVTSDTGDIADNDVALATQFVFDRATELSMPAVVNLSLGADFGAHDGSSSLSQLLDGFVGPTHPGRAIVVAAGNSGQLLRGITKQFQEPLGIHTEVDVKATAGVRLPLLTPYPSSGKDVTTASIFVWLNLYAAADLSIGLELPDGTFVEPIGVGQTQLANTKDIVAVVLHGTDDPAERAQLESALGASSGEDLVPGQGSAVVLIDGSWKAGGTFGIDLVGHGRAELWAQSEGDLSPEAGSAGAIFPAATAQQTVTIPASDPALIAVGASINRLDWTDANGDVVHPDGSRLDAPLAVGEAAFFSSAGPNRGGDFKPDLLAPGGFVVGALSAAADPRRGGTGVFAGLCSPLGCQVVSDDYALTAGTSMAAPLVSGAVALLLQHDPTLTQDALRGLLQAGSDVVAPAPDPSSRAGGGALNLGQTFRALSAAAPSGNARPDATQSRLRVAGDYAVPDATRSLAALLWLRDADGSIFDAPLERLSVRVRGGQLASEPARVGPGLYSLRVSSSADTRDPALRIDVSVDEQAFLSLELPVDGVEAQTSSKGGCDLVGVRAARSTDAARALFACALAAVALYRRRCSVRAPAARRAAARGAAAQSSAR